jgi:hypothetical protein
MRSYRQHFAKNQPFARNIITKNFTAKADENILFKIVHHFCTFAFKWKMQPKIGLFTTTEYWPQISYD